MTSISPVSAIGPAPRAYAHQQVQAAVSPALSDPAALRSQPKAQLRRYETLSLLPGGGIGESHHVAPALPLFEDAFCAFARGTLVDTDAGPVAIEDLLPGDQVHADDGSTLPLLWKGRTVVVPGRPTPQGRDLHLTRIMADSFGLQRPLSCVLIGPSARLLHRPAQPGAADAMASILTPVQRFRDGSNVIETAPPRAVELFHICLSRHAVIRVSGLGFETYHPGPDALQPLSHAMRTVYMNLFPHIDQFADFGPLRHERAELRPDEI